MEILGDPYSGLSDTPDGISPVVGIRAWKIRSNPRKQERLYSIHKQEVSWPIKKRLEAKCIKPIQIWGKGFWEWHKRVTEGYYHDDDEEEFLHPHVSPLPSCQCGIYALKSFPASNEIKPWEPNEIIGLVFLWGRILEGVRGYRGQYAKIAALWSDPKRIDRNKLNNIAEIYQIPVIKNLGEELDRQRHLQ